MSFKYVKEDASQICKYDEDVFILAYGLAERDIAMSELINKHTNIIKNIILLRYNNIKIEPLQELFPKCNFDIIDVHGDQVEFLGKLKALHKKLKNKRILIDISNIHLPEMFIILKYIKTISPELLLKVAYSIPFEYEFQNQPFTSYHSYKGNLTTSDIIGFSGSSGDLPYSKMIIFLGFEGVLAKKIIEDIQYKQLILVNTLPSYYIKYKDINIINNFDLLTSHNNKMLYVPADNPFEIVNFLVKNLNNEEDTCIAAISTKLIGLGVCMYGLKHNNVRVVYPQSDSYDSIKTTNRVYKTNLYHINLAELKMN